MIISNAYDEIISWRIELDLGHGLVLRIRLANVLPRDLCVDIALQPPDRYAQAEETSNRGDQLHAAHLRACPSIPTT
jgi:hypothetical protein